MAATTTEPKRQAPRKPSAGWVFGGALGAFFAVLAGIGFQAEAPAEPAPVVVQREPRQVVVRRVIKTVVIHHRAAAPRKSAPAQTASAPAPAPAAPAPPPAPAPLTTQSS
jgi:hypothetical protein